MFPALARKGEATWPSHRSCLHPGQGHRQTRWPQMGKEVKPSAPWPGCDGGDDFHERPDRYPPQLQSYEFFKAVGNNKTNNDDAAWGLLGIFFLFDNF